MKKILILFFAVIQLLCFSQSTNLNGWMKNGNVLGNNTSFIGSLDARGIWMKAFNRYFFHADSSASVNLKFGDINNYANGTYIELDDPSGAITLQGETYFKSNVIFSPTSQYSYGNDRLGIGIGAVSPSAKIHIGVASSPNEPQLLFDSSPTYSSTLSGAVHYDNTLNGYTFRQNYNDNCWSMSITDGTVTTTMHNSNYPGQASYAGAWFGTRTNNNTHLFVNGDGGGLPALSVITRTGTPCVAINAGPETFTSQSVSNAAFIVYGGSAPDILSARSGTALSNVFNISKLGTGSQNCNATIKGHLIGATSTPTAVIGTGAGTGATFTITGNDMAGYIDITTSGTPAGSNATILTITFNIPYTVAPVVLLDKQGPNSAALSGVTNPYIDSQSTTTNVFILKSGTTGLTTGTIYRFAYHVIGK